jgi:transposase
MVGVYKLEIHESTEELKQLLRSQTTAQGKERIQVLYLLQTQQAETIQAAAELVGRNRVTVQKWLQHYRNGGLRGLLRSKKPTGRPRKLPAWAEQALSKRLQNPEGFESYQAICDWYENTLGLTVAYKTVHKLVHQRLGGLPKVPRPVSDKQSSEQLEAYKKT